MSVGDLFDSAELLYSRRTPSPHGREHWEISCAGDLLATVVETRLTLLDHAGRLLNNLFPAQRRHRLEVRDPGGRTLFGMVRQPPRLGLEHADVRTGDGAPIGTVRLVRTGEDDGLGLYDTRDVRVGEARPDRRTTAATGHRTFALVGADGRPIGRFSSTTTRGGTGPAGYRLTITAEPPAPPEPLRTLVYATPIARFFMR